VGLEFGGPRVGQVVADQLERSAGLLPCCFCKRKKEEGKKEGERWSEIVSAVGLEFGGPRIGQVVADQLEGSAVFL